jgi:DNA-binding NarL/FixJ family response regulator
VPTPNERIRVLLVDDHELAREAMRSVLSPEQGFHVVGEAGDGATAIRLVHELAPALVVMDVQMPGIDGLVATRTILAEQPGVRVVILTSYEQRPLVLEALRAGAAGYLLKGATKQEVLATVRAILAGERRIQSSLAIALLVEDCRGGVAPTVTTALTPRQLEIVRLIAAGRSNSEIAVAQRLTLNTVKTHVRHILQKLEATDRANAVARAAALGLLPGEPTAAL